MTSHNRLDDSLSEREDINVAFCSATRGLLTTNCVILNHGHVTGMTFELAPPLLTTTPTGERLSSRQTADPHARTPCILGGYLVALGIETRPSSLESNALTTRLPTAILHGLDVVHGRRIPRQTVHSCLADAYNLVWCMFDVGTVNSQRYKDGSLLDVLGLDYILRDSDEFQEGVDLHLKVSESRLY
ncbi:hypothetical protein TNCV_2606691 [Trichonephila clavipes]|uniref:Uncharacterized protein n=1 Tax=Trichonephila clavipes TaxID=2585209 RepID=A0A8X6S214_TRICX|nr:hypothetical protein TNCV_2606691 [Trichonephila clavipes]